MYFKNFFTLRRIPVFVLLICVFAIQKETVSQDKTQITDAEIIQIIITVDQHEMNAANVAKIKDISAPVMDYANMLFTQHSDNLYQANLIADSIGVKPVNSATSRELKQKGNKGMASLRPLRGTEFEKAYVTAMVNGHQEVLDLIDKQLLPQATSSALKSFLTETRNSVAMHLDMGKKLQ